jgi:hypothetical protein
MRNEYPRNMNVRGNILTTSGENDASPSKTVAGGYPRLTKLDWQPFGRVYGFISILGKLYGR